MATVGVVEPSFTASAAPSDEEVIEYVTALADQLENPTEAQKFAANVKQVGVWANEIDASFYRVTRKFEEMVNAYGRDFPGFSNYLTEWILYNKRWVELLQKSRDVASTTISMLKRFDKVFLEIIEEVETDKDREDAIIELQSFIDEEHPGHVEMYQGFLDLKRDIEDFVRRLDAFILTTGTRLAQRAIELQNEIAGLVGEIEEWDRKIAVAEKALIAMGAIISILGLIVAGSVVASYRKSRAAKVAELDTKQAELEDVNRQQAALAQLQSDFDGVKPDIQLICDRLIMFAEIWSSVRSQTVQFQNMLKGGQTAATNLRFRKEIRLARATCEPLQDGLQKYANELENRPNK